MPEAYLRRLKKWTADNQIRYCDLIHWHGDGSIAAIELDELDWLQRERKRLGYPVSRRERVTNAAFKKQSRGWLTHRLRRRRRLGEVLVVLDPWAGETWPGMTPLCEKIADFVKAWKGPKFVALFQNLRGSPLEELRPELGRYSRPRIHPALADIRWTKRWTFQDPSAIEHEIWQYRKAHLMGVSTDIFIHQAALELASRGVVPVVHAGLCGSPSGTALHRSALVSLRRFIGEAQVVD